MVTFGGIMKIQMEKLHVKQEVLAKQLNIARTTVTSYCNDKRQPDFEMMKKICQCLEINLTQAMGLCHYDNQDMILHDDFEYKVNQAARKVKKKDRKQFMKGIVYLAEILGEDQ